MGPPSIPSPDTISVAAFSELLGRYGAVAAAVSAAKGAKPGQKTLEQLDAFRYGTAPAQFGTPARRRMTLADVETLVDWKLRHGKFRPTLMKLVASNDPKTVEATVQEALQAYDAAPTGGAAAAAAAAALRVLCRLRGIGPATASLLLAVHHPQTVLFFSDEAYAWLCGGAARTPPRTYSDKEYAALAQRGAGLMARLAQSAGADAADDVGAQAVEQVAYVLMRGGGAGVGSPDEKPAKQKTPTPADTAPRTKRKQPPTDAAPATGPARRSGRLRR